MRNSKTDKKNIALGKQVAKLRGDIDLYRLVGLNHHQLSKSDISTAFLGHIQSLAHSSIAVGICKIFEEAKRNYLDSIPGIIESLPQKELSSQSHSKVKIFGELHGNHAQAVDPEAYLRGTLGLFIGLHSSSLNELRRFRDKVGAHCESKVSTNVLPSLGEFEAYFIFAKSFYDLISDVYIEARPVKIARQPGKGFVKLMKSMGIDEPKFDFD